MEAPAITRFGYLLVATFLLLVLQGFVPPGDVQQLLVTALAGATLVLAVHAAEVDPKWIRAVALLALVATLVALFRALTGDVSEGASRLVNAALVALGPPAVVIGVVRAVRSAGTVRVEAVAGVLSLYMLLGMFFSFIYGAIDNLGDQPFFTNGEPATVSRCLYFSFTTLTTVGYGDLTARSDAGHTLAVLEALTGQIYLVTVVSLIVGNLGRSAVNRKAEA
jgi:hypothetical protein